MSESTDHPPASDLKSQVNVLVDTSWTLERSGRDPRPRHIRLVCRGAGVPQHPIPRCSPFPVPPGSVGVRMDQVRGEEEPEEAGEPPG